MAVGSINLNTNILNNYSKSNFEHFADGLGKPFNALESQLEGSMNEIGALGTGKLSAMTANALQHLDMQSKLNKLTSGLEKGLAAITKIAKMPGQFIADVFKAVTKGLGKFISAAVNFGKTVLGGLKNAFKGLLNSLGLGKLGKLLEKALKTIMNVLGLPFKFLGRMLNKAKNFIINLLSPLGGTARDKKSLYDGLYNDNADNYITETSNIFKKGMIVPILSDGNYNSNEELYFASKSFVNGSDYNTVLDSYTSIFRDGSYKNNTNVNYHTVYGWLQDEANEKDKNESNFVKRKFIDNEIGGFYNDFEFEFTGRRFMNMSDEEYERLMGGSNLPKRAKNKSIMEKLPSKTTILNDDIESYTMKNSERLDGDLDDLDKLLIFSPKNTEGFYEDKSNKPVDEPKVFFNSNKFGTENKNNKVTVTKFNGFSKDSKMMDMVRKEYDKHEDELKEKAKADFKKRLKKTTKVF